MDPEVQRIVLLDAPVVLSWEAWREVDARYGLGSLKQGLREAQAAGAIAGDDLDAVAHLLLGAMNEVAMWIARAADPSAGLPTTASMPPRRASRTGGLRRDSSKTSA